MAGEPVGVLLMAYGTPASLDGVEAYYTDIRRGRPPTPEQLAELQSRYAAIGGISPLLARTRAQVAGVAAALGEGFVCALGQKHAAPFIEDAAAGLAGAGVSSVVGVVLAPHYSVLSVGEYHARAEAALDGRVPYAGVRSWHLEPGLVSALADRVRAALASFDDGERVLTLVTAHSLPARVLELGDPYPAQLAETAAAVMEQAGVPEGGWRVAWQSAGRTPEPWLGPDILEVIGSLDGFDGVVVCPAGFTSDHLEVLYDVDVQARAAASERGLRLVRTESLNDDPALCSVLAAVIRRVAPAATPAPPPPTTVSAVERVVGDGGRRR